jgi:flagellar basal-body rod modification protein FlgD
MDVSSVSQTSGTGAAQSIGTVSTDAFMKLLVVQLRSQNPMEPMDPNQFMDQLVQFNTLEQLIDIRQILQAGISNSAAPNTSVPVVGSKPA